MTFHPPTASQVVAISAAGAAVIMAVTPVLPPTTPEWVRSALVIALAVLLVFTRKLGDKPPAGGGAS